MQRKQIAAANWKMNLTWEAGADLVRQLKEGYQPAPGAEVVLFLPAPYLMPAQELLRGSDIRLGAQNCHDEDWGAFTGELSAALLASIGITHCLVGHSERREYFSEDASFLSRKVDALLRHSLTPVFCCGEPLAIRDAGTELAHVEGQVRDSLFHLDGEAVLKVVIAYEPVWAIGTGRTASTEQAQAMHRHLRSVLEQQWGADVAARVPILYGGSVKGANAGELFAAEDVDGGLVGGASLSATEFSAIIKSLRP